MVRRLYQEWKGSNKFFLGGRLIFGPDVRSLGASVILIVVPVAVFCVFVASPLAHRLYYPGGIVVLVVTVVYTLYVLFLLFITASRDPGIIPRNAHPPECEAGSDSQVSQDDWSEDQTPRLRIPRTKNVIINGAVVKVKYCDTCKLYRPPRCSHCSICNNCVQHFDHHCPWVGQCIGLRNYRYFFLFVASTTLLCIFVFTMSAFYFKLLIDGHPHPVWMAIKKSPVSVILMIYTFIAIWFVGGLTVFHSYLISINQTTYENFRYRYEDRENTFNRGILRNLFEIFCTSIPPSKVKFRSKITKDASFHDLGKAEGMHSAVNFTTKTVDVEMGAKPMASSLASQMIVGDVEVSHRELSNGVEPGRENKGATEDGTLENLEHSAHEDDFRAGTHPGSSSWNRISGSWDFSRESLALALSEDARMKGNSSSPSSR